MLILFLEGDVVAAVVSCGWASSVWRGAALDVVAAGRDVTLARLCASLHAQGQQANTRCGVMYNQTKKHT